MLTNDDSYVLPQGNNSTIEWLKGHVNNNNYQKSNMEKLQDKSLDVKMLSMLNYTPHPL